MKQPSLFISHGAPDIVISPSEIRSFLIDLGKEIVETRKPDAIVIASAHFETRMPEVVSDPNPEMIYDFGGFAPELYQMQYPAPGNADLAGEVASLLDKAGIQNSLNNKRGYDHGSWTPLKLMFPSADIPVVQVSIQPHQNATHHHKLGRALEALRAQNVMTLGSGHITHNLRAVFGAMRDGVADQVMADKVDAFTEWMAEKLKIGDLESVLNWEHAAPFARENHPTSEHLMPLFFALGAGGEDGKAERLHTSKQYGMFVSDVWKFD